MNDRRRGTGLAALAGLAAALGQEPTHLPWISLFALSAGLAMILCAATPRAAFWRGWALGAGYFAITLHWIIEPFLVDIATYGWMAPFALVLMAGGLALFWGGAAALGVIFSGQGGLVWRAVALASVLTSAEMLRAVIFTGFPWGMVGTIWVGTPVAQAAAVVGAHGLNALTYLAAAGLGVGMIARHRAGLGAMGLCALPLLFALGGGALVLARTPNAVPDIRPMIRLIQPNAAQNLKWRADMIPVFWQRKLALTMAPTQTGARPDLVVWPEVSLPYFLGQGPQADRDIADAAGGAPVIVGVQRLDAVGLYNSMAVLGPDGAIGAVYDKHHLVPFGEYFPGGALAARFGLKGLATLGPGGFSAGPGPQILDLTGQGLGRALPLICYEAIFPRHTRVAGPRADWIVQITNDAWFGDFAGPQQHLAQARLRAIETGLPMVRVANTGISAMIDPLGRLSAQLPLGRDGYLDARLPAPKPETLYGKLANGPLLLVLACVLLLVLRRRRTQHAG